MKLYHSPGACSLATHVLLREIGGRFELIPISTAMAENRTPEYLRINPRGRVPALEERGEVHTESAALLTWLAMAHPGPGLLPDSGTPELARCLEWVAWFSTSLHVAYLQHWRPERHVGDAAATADLTQYALRLITDMNREVEERLTGPWFVGEGYSIADIYALVFYGWGHRLGLPMTNEYPRWSEWARRMVARPAVGQAIAHERIESWYPAVPG